MQRGEPVEHPPIVDHAVETDGGDINTCFVETTAQGFSLVSKDIVFCNFDQGGRKTL